MKIQSIKHLAVSWAAVLVAASIITAKAGTNNVAGPPQTHTLPAGTIKFINIPFSEILPIYAMLTGAEMDTNRLKGIPPVLMSFENKKPLTPRQAVQLLDKVFYDHGILATHVDKKHIVFTPRSAQKAK